MNSKSIVAITLGILLLTAGTAIAIAQLDANSSSAAGITSALLISLMWCIGLFITIGLLLKQSKRHLADVENEAHQRWMYEKAIRDATLDALITINDEGEVLDFSYAAESTFGIKRQDAIGENIADLIIPHQYQSAHRQGMAHYNATGEGPVLNQRIEIEAMRSNGDVFPCELTVIPIRFENSTHFTAFVRDISERFEAQEALKAASQQAEAASKAKTRFLTTMSHEMRSPLTSIIGALELLRSKLKDTEQLNWVSTAQGSCSTMLSLVNDVLDMSRIETGSLELNPVIFEPHAMLYSLNEIGQLKAQEKQLSLCPLIAGPMPQTLVGDETRIRQIVTNLIDNAIKFTREGYINVYLTYRENDDGRGFLTFRVVDTGIGIAAEAQKQLFDEFYQVDSSNTTPFDGTGLGLSIVKELVDMMGGDIQLTSEEGKGTDITVELPLARPPDSELMPLSYDAKLSLVAEPSHHTDALLKQLQMFSIEAQHLTPDSLDGADLTSVDRVMIQDSLVEHIPASVRNSAASVVFSFNPSTAHLYPFSVDAIDQLLSQDSDPERSKRAEYRSESLLHQRAQRTILLAEDNKANQQVLVAMIQQSGYQILTVDNGAQAISMAQNESVDMILMDMRMPELDGVSATQELRKLGFKRPIVAMTANAMPADISACIDAGMDDFLTKPVRANVLVSLIDRWLSIGAQSDNAHEQNEAMTSDTEGPLYDPDTIERLKQDVGADSIQQILELFVEEMEQARKQLSEPDPSREQWRDIAHKIKSSAGFYGARKLYHSAHALELNCKDGDAQDLDARVQHFDQCLLQTIERYRQGVE